MNEDPPHIEKEQDNPHWEKIKELLFDKDGNPRFDFNVDYERIEAYVAASVAAKEARTNRYLLFLSLSLLLALSVGVVGFYYYSRTTLIEIPYSSKAELIRIGENDFYVAPFTKGTISIIDRSEEIHARSNDGQFYIRKFSEGDLFIETDSLIVRLGQGTANIVTRGGIQKVSVLSGDGAQVIFPDADRKIDVGAGQELRNYNGHANLRSFNRGEVGNWTIGYYVYNNEPLDLILSDIERNFLIKIVRPPETSSMLASGIFDRQQDVLEILRSLLPALATVTKTDEQTYTITFERTK